MIEYMGYIGVFEYEPELDALYGHVVNTRDVVTFQGGSVDEVKEEFQRSVDVYLKVCEERGVSPDKPFSGRFNIRPGPELHGRIVAAAEAEGISMNDWIVRRIERSLDKGRVSMVRTRGSSTKNLVGGAVPEKHKDAAKVTQKGAGKVKGASKGEARSPKPAKH